MDNIEVVSPITAKAEIKKYTLVGDDIYIRRYTNDTIPTWYKQLISDIIASDNTILDVNSAIAYLSQLSDGYSTIVSELVKQIPLLIHIWKI